MEDNSTTSLVEVLGILGEIEAICETLDPKIDQDVNDLLWFIMQKGADLAATPHGDMTAKLAESLCNLVRLLPAGEGQTNTQKTAAMILWTLI